MARRLWFPLLLVLLALTATTAQQTACPASLKECSKNGFCKFGETSGIVCECFDEFSGDLCSTVSKNLVEQGDTAFDLAFGILISVTLISVTFHLCNTKITARHRWGLGLVPLIVQMQQFALIIAYNVDLEAADLVKPFRRALIMLGDGVSDTKTAIVDDFTGEPARSWQHLVPKMIIISLVMAFELIVANACRMCNTTLRHRHFTWVYLVFLLPVLGDSLLGSLQVCDTCKENPDVASGLVYALIMATLIIVARRVILPRLYAGPLFFLFPGSGWCSSSGSGRSAQPVGADADPADEHLIEIDRTISGVAPRTENDYRSFDANSRLRRLARRQRIRNDNIVVWDKFPFAGLFEDSLLYEATEDPFDNGDAMCWAAKLMVDNIRRSIAHLFVFIDLGYFVTFAIVAVSFTNTQQTGWLLVLVVIYTLLLTITVPYTIGVMLCIVVTQCGLGTQLVLVHLMLEDHNLAQWHVSLIVYTQVVIIVAFLVIRFSVTSRNSGAKLRSASHHHAILEGEDATLELITDRQRTVAEGIKLGEKNPVMPPEWTICWTLTCFNTACRQFAVLKCSKGHGPVRGTSLRDGPVCFQCAGLDTLFADQKRLDIIQARRTSLALELDSRADRQSSSVPPLDLLSSVNHTTIVLDALAKFHQDSPTLLDGFPRNVNDIEEWSSRKDNRIIVPIVLLIDEDAAAVRRADDTFGSGHNSNAALPAVLYQANAQNEHASMEDLMELYGSKQMPPDDNASSSWSSSSSDESSAPDDDDERKEPEPGSKKKQQQRKQNAVVEYFAERKLLTRVSGTAAQISNRISELIQQTLLESGQFTVVVVNSQDVDDAIRVSEAAGFLVEGRKTFQLSTEQAQLIDQDWQDKKEMAALILQREHGDAVRNWKKMTDEEHKPEWYGSATVDDVQRDLSQFFPEKFGHVWPKYQRKRIVLFVLPTKTNNRRLTQGVAKQFRLNYVNSDDVHIAAQARQLDTPPTRACPTCSQHSACVQRRFVRQNDNYRLLDALHGAKNKEELHTASLSCSQCAAFVLPVVGKQCLTWHNCQFKDESTGKLILPTSKSVPHIKAGCKGVPLAEPIIVDRERLLVKVKAMLKHAPARRRSSVAGRGINRYVAATEAAAAAAAAAKEEKEKEEEDKHEPEIVPGENDADLSHSDDEREKEEEDADDENEDEEDEVAPSPSPSPAPPTPPSPSPAPPSPPPEHHVDEQSDQDELPPPPAAESSSDDEDEDDLPPPPGSEFEEPDKLFNMGDGYSDSDE